MEVVPSSGRLQARERQRQLLCSHTHRPADSSYPARPTTARKGYVGTNGELAGNGLCSSLASTRQLEVWLQGRQAGSPSSAQDPPLCIRGPSFWRRPQVPVPSQHAWLVALPFPIPPPADTGQTAPARPVPHSTAAALRQAPFSIMWMSMSTQDSHRLGRLTDCCWLQSVDEPTDMPGE